MAKSKRKTIDKQPGETGPPTKFSEERLKIILDAIQRAVPIKRACELAMITDQTLRNWTKEDDLILLKVREAKAKAVERLVGKVEDKDPWKILKNADREHFKDHVEETVVERFEFAIDAGDGEEDVFGGY